MRKTDKDYEHKGGVRKVIKNSQRKQDQITDTIQLEERVFSSAETFVLQKKKTSALTID